MIWEYIKYKIKETLNYFSEEPGVVKPVVERVEYL